ncbi:MAG: NAD(P)-dependent dehydrogenase (short-subunit alcohol dehydrogenase family) [Candidatus Azotimanducaceae bacterium]|jgi:NAD(P)-dependent dehydrogenase (short-subunit alcohol dehydrogenase family)
MSKPFGAKTSADEAVDGRDLTSKFVIVTGANTGIGFETARALARAGAAVIVACRSESTGQVAANKINKLNKDHSTAGKAEFRKLDLSSAVSIQQFCRELQADTIDILICNAGLVSGEYKETAEGLELTVGVCHYGHFLLSVLLLPKLLAAQASRVVMVSSASHASPRNLDFDAFLLSAKNFKMMLAYGQAKLANVLMANELQRRYSNQGLTACSLHPGTLITTDIGRSSIFMSFMMKLISPLTKNPSQGASTTICCALEEADRVAAQYFSHCQPAKMTTEAADPKTSSKLWDLSEAWVKKTVPGIAIPAVNESPIA